MAKGGKLGARARREALRQAGGSAMAGGAVSPTSKQSITVARYDGAGTGRRMSGWSAPSSGPNLAMQGLPTLRNRQRDAERNDWQAANGTRVWATNLVGTGITARSVMDVPEALRKRSKAVWGDWLRQCDADGVLDLYGMQTLATRGLVSAGEVFVRLRPRRPEDNLPVPLQIQLLESDMVPMLDADMWPGLPPGSRIRSGIELDRIGRRAAYWAYRWHPGDRPGAPEPNQLTRIPARFMRHIFEPLRPGQLRGVSEFAPIIAKLRSVGNFDDAVLQRQEIANLFTMFITREPSAADAQINPVTGLAHAAFAANGTPIATLEPGISQELNAGEGVEFSDPPDAGANYADYMRQQHLGVSSGGGLPYELLTGDIKDVSDRTLRVVINEFRRRCEQRQWQVIIPMMCQPIRDAFAEAGALAGVFSAREAELVKKVTWQPQGWAYIHPTQDALGKKTEVDAGFRSRESVILERGDDPEEVDAQIARDTFTASAARGKAA